ncbi:MAG: hypothetical protein ACFFBP_06050 [Promethearchaeota archaeon]
MFKFKAKRILGKKDTIIFIGAIEFDTDALEKDCLEFSYYHFKNLANKNLIQLCEGNNDNIIRICKP